MDLRARAPLLLSCMLLFSLLLCDATAARSQYDYCQAPPEVDASGIDPRDLNMTLQLVSVVIRHGDRVPVNVLPGGYDDNVVWHCELDQLSGISIGDAVQGPRFVRKRYADGRQVLPGNCMFGQLTEKGAGQHNRLGARLRELYIEKYAFLSPRISPSQIYVRSTDVPRTIGSAQSLIFGLYPEDGVQGAPSWPLLDIITIDSNKENMVPNVRLCPALGQLYQELLRSTQWEAHELRVGPLKQSIRALFNLSINATISFSELFDVVQARTCHGLPLPDGLLPLASDIIAAGNFEQSFYYGNKVALGLGIGSFVGELLAAMEKSLTSSEFPKFLLYSGHDTTVWPLAFALGFGANQQWPPYASHMTIELWKSAAGHFVRLLYNGQPITPPVKREDSCRWDQFRAAAGAIVPQDFHRICATTTATTTTRE